MSSSHRDLLAWQKAKALAVQVCRKTEDFPGNEVYGLASQIRRSAVSVPSNIAEGQGRLTLGDFIQFLDHARGSLLELRTQLEIAQELGYLTDTDLAQLDKLAFDIGGRLNRLIEPLQEKSQAARA